MKANYRTVTIFALALVIFGLQTIYAQGVTTASFSGRITDQDGAGLVGANVIATHVPSGTQYVGRHAMTAGTIFSTYVWADRIQSP